MAARSPHGPFKVIKSAVVLTNRLLWWGQQTFTLGALAGQLAGATDGFSLLACALFRGLLIVHVPLHFAERAFTLHLLLQRLEGLIDIIVAHENLNQRSLSCHPFPIG